MAKTFDGYTKQQAKAIHQALKDANLKQNADWRGRILPDITTLTVDLCEGNAHPDSLMYTGEVKRRFAVLKTRLEAAVQAYEQLGERLQWHLDDQCQIWDIASSGEEWAALVSKQTGQHICPTPITGRYSFRQLLDSALSAVRLAAEQPNPHIYLQTTGAPKNHVTRLAVNALMDIFEKATGIEPKVNYNYHTKTEDPYDGTFYKFAVACLAPVFPDTAYQLGSPIRIASRQR